MGLPTTDEPENAGLPHINWMGGNSTDLVEVSRVAELEANGDITTGAEFFCITTSGAGGITVPLFDSEPVAGNLRGADFRPGWESAP